ncbi:hypothetical protein BO71DRAFT_132342 [Aspergillus ellipticus CBS 707.79]|uniref:Uncharacterized protein n=1 Tax=Aspergillus ellipticus CBS 707.79 TaxID=1448320 RepID=A0A319CTK7_9EURO|nr:hypothetical protein BO71DRAFT_132342 [Aspergillus ellipticus CBS 707.79]
MAFDMPIACSVPALVQTRHQRLGSAMRGLTGSRFRCSGEDQSVSIMLRNAKVTATLPLLVLAATLAASGVSCSCSCSCPCLRWACTFVELPDCSIGQYSAVQCVLRPAWCLDTAQNRGRTATTREGWKVWRGKPSAITRTLAKRWIGGVVS